jgi:hypothetical protein
MKAKVAPAAINTGLARPAGTGSTNDLLYTLWGGTDKSINDRGNAYFNAPSGPAFRAASSTTTITGSGSNYGYTIPIPTGTVAGDVLIAQVYFVYDNKSGARGNAPAGWTERAVGDDLNYPHLVWRTYSRVATGSDSFVWSGGVNWFDGILVAGMISISGGSAVDVVGTRTIAGAIAPSVTTTTAPTLLVGLWQTQGNTTAAPASMTARMNVNQTGGPSLVIATEPLSVSGATGTRTSPTVNVSTRFSQLIAVK